MSTHEFKTRFSKGDRVYYIDNGEDDTGTVVHVKVAHDRENEMLSVSYVVHFDTGGAGAVDEFSAIQLDTVG